MSKAKFTQGPWRSSGLLDVEDSENQLLATIDDYDRSVGERAEMKRLTVTHCLIRAVVGAIILAPILIALSYICT